VTTDEILSMGEFCETLMREEHFIELARTFELQCFEHFTSTSAHEAKKREGVYAEFHGFKNFLAHMAAFVAAKNKLIAPSTDAPIEDD
jgi:hypothetical protein